MLSPYNLTLIIMMILIMRLVGFVYYCFRNWHKACHESARGKEGLSGICYWIFQRQTLTLSRDSLYIHVFIRIGIMFLLSINLLFSSFKLQSNRLCVLCFSVSPTNLSQFNLPGPSMMRSNSIPAQDSSFDLYDDSQLCGSATSLEERPRAISHSGSFRDSMEEGKCWGGIKMKSLYFNPERETIASLTSQRFLKRKIN